MKNLLIILVVHLMAAGLANADDCSEKTITQTNPVKYEVNKNLPKYLQGATITVRLANGKETTVPAERFAVVPRVQQFVVGQAVNTSKTLTCKAKVNKNTVSVGMRKDVTGLSKQASVIPNGQQLKITQDKELIPDINYYRRNVLDSHLGAGVGVDTKGVPRIQVGFDF